MNELFQLMYEYRHLVSRRARSHGVLTAASAERLEGLERLFGQEPDDKAAATDPTRRRRHARCDTRHPATIRVGDRTEAIEVINMGGGGVRIHPAPELKPGQRTILHVPVLDGASELHFPVRVSWVGRDEGAPIMGLPFLARPSQVWLAP